MCCNWTKGTWAGAGKKEAPKGFVSCGIKQLGMAKTAAHPDYLREGDFTTITYFDSEIVAVQFVWLSNKTKHDSGVAPLISFIANSCFGRAPIS